LTWPARSRSIGSRSKGCGRARVKRGRRADQMRQISIRRCRMRASGCEAAGDDRRRQPAASGGGARRGTRSRAPGLGSVRGRHLDAARETANSSRAALAAGTRRRRHTTRRRGSGSGGAPASNCGRHGARGWRRATWVLSSPPSAALGELLDDEAAAAAKTEDGGAT
jgi:hypothetical protein